MIRKIELFTITMLLGSLATGCSTDVVGYRALASADGGGGGGGGDDAAVGSGDTGAPGQDVPATADVPVSTCVSGTHWTRGNRGSELMRPGEACIACHVSMNSEGPDLIGGTAYSDPLQVNNCNGFRGSNSTATGSAYIEATDAAGVTFRMAINSSGNFLYEGAPLQLPLHGVTAVSPSGARNEMTSEAPNGDCNTCHTQMGTTTVAGGDPAPGRILLLP